MEKVKWSIDDILCFRCARFLRIQPSLADERDATVICKDIRGTGYGYKPLRLYCPEFVEKPTDCTKCSPVTIGWCTGDCKKCEKRTEWEAWAE